MNRLRSYLENWFGLALWALLLTLALAFLAPSAHENGALMRPLIIAFELLRPNARRPLKWRLARAALWLLALLWQVNGPVPQDVTFFVHLVDDQSQLVDQADGEPLAGTYPFWLWPAGTIVQDRRYVQEGSAGRSFLAGLYRRSDGQRPQAESPSGQPWQDNAVPIPLAP